LKVMFVFSGRFIGNGSDVEYDKKKTKKKKIVGLCGRQNRSF